MTPPKFLPALESLMERATKRPWSLCEHSWSDTSIIGSGNRKVCTMSIADIATEDTQELEEKWMAADAELIALLANHAPAIARLVRAAEDALLAINMGLGQTDAEYEDAVKQAIKARDAVTQALAALNAGNAEDKP